MISNISAKGVPGFDDHELVYQIHLPEAKLKGFIAIHRRHNGFPSFGATRVRNYESNEDALTDALRLSNLMTFKSKGAGLPYGGAKAVLKLPQGKFDRKRYFEAYAQAVNELKGAFITGADIGVEMKDVHVMRKASQYIVGVDVDPVYYTAVGVYDGILETLSALGGKKIEDTTIVIQGVGKVGMATLKLLYPHKPKLYICDTDLKQVEEANKEFPAAIRVDSDDIYDVQGTIFAPCAVGGVLTRASIARLNVEAVVGSANNQLLSSDDAQLLQDKHILYAPDFIVNAGGLISVTHEYEEATFTAKSTIEEKVAGIRKRLMAIYMEAKRTGENTHKVAQRLYQ